MAAKYTFRRAKMPDAREIHSLLNFFADRRELLPRSLSEVYENLQQFFVVLWRGKVVGCCALYITWEKLAEVKALAVAPQHQKKKLGRRLLKMAITEAKKLGVETLFTLTIRENLFKKFGFVRTTKSFLPHKVWTECVRCPYFPNACIETSLTLNLKSKSRRPSKDQLSTDFMATAAPLIPNEPAKPIWPPPDPPSRIKA